MWRWCSRAERCKCYVNEITFALAAEELIAGDMQGYGVEWTSDERRRTFAFTSCLFFFWICLLYVDETILARPDAAFWAKIFVQNILLACVFVLCGYFVTFYELDESYSRKICHIFAYALPVFLHFLWGGVVDTTLPSSIELIWSCWFQFIPFFALIKPVRRKSFFLMLAFRAIDRKNDRPYTLVWMLSQLLANYIPILIFNSYLYSQKQAEIMRLALLPVLVNVFGDGLAEPVGTRWGRNKYRTSALWYDGAFCNGTFERSYEGSACVYFATLLSLVGFQQAFSASQFITAMVLLPITMALCEAWAPHTWDNPFLTTICGAFIVCTYEYIP